MSNVIPSFLTRIDFWAMLLSGYLLIILGIVLFFPSFVYDPNLVTTTVKNNTDNTTTTSKTGSIPFDIFSAIEFLVAGPAIGFTLSQEVIFFSFIMFFRNKYEFARAYSNLRTKCNESTRLELDPIDARVTFNSSTGVALIIISLLLGLQHLISIDPLIRNDDIRYRVISTLLAFFSGLIFIVIAYLEVANVRVPLICKLLKEHNIETPAEHCKKFEQDKEIQNKGEAP
jgi:hypothetical protein